MASIEALAAFMAATVAVALLPGPAMLYTAAQTIARGRRAGFLAVLGIHIGGYFHVIVAAAGLSAVLHAVPTLYIAVKMAGALYLIWLGFNLIATTSTPESGMTTEAVAPASRSPFYESAIVQVLNPKVALFFIAFLPQFVDPAATLPAWMQFLILGLVVNFTFSAADGLCVMIASTIVQRMAHDSSLKRWCRRGGGAMLVGLGLHLGLQRA